MRVTACGALTEVVLARQVVILLGANVWMACLTLLADVAGCVLCLWISPVFGSWWRWLLVRLVCLGHVVCACALAVGDPGIVWQSPARDPEEPCERCDTCDLTFPADMDIVHCEDCNLCIAGQHHHCAFLAKCVARNNFWIFWIWVTLLSSSFLLPPILANDLPPP